jgi:hypothetical protein
MQIEYEPKSGGPSGTPDKRRKWKGIFSRNRKAGNAGTRKQQVPSELPRPRIATPPRSTTSNTNLYGPDTIYGPDLSLIGRASVTLSDDDSSLGMGPPIPDDPSTSGSIQLEEDERSIGNMFKRIFKGKKKKSEQPSVPAQSSEEDDYVPQFDPLTASASDDMIMGPPIPVPAPHLLNLAPSGPFGVMVPSVPLGITQNSGPSFMPTTPPLGLDDTTPDESGEQISDAPPETIAQKSEPINLPATLLEPKSSNSVIINHLMVCCLQILLSGNSPYNPSAPT